MIREIGIKRDSGKTSLSCNRSFEPYFSDFINLSNVSNIKNVWIFK